jgi:UDP-N-acetylmuramoyl-tripeptide--D-alanyl-D-alanine ligase
MLCAECLNLFQGVGYRAREYFPRLSGARIKRAAVLSAAAAAGLLLVDALAAGTAYGLLGLAVLAAVAAVGVARAPVPQKTPTVATRRLKRLMIAFAVVAYALGTGVLWAGFALLPRFPTVLFGAALGLYIVVLPAAGWLTAPLEACIRRKFARDARKKVESCHALKVIGVTGSYGKTSVKNILYDILKRKFRVLMSPASYNTPMGLCRTVNERLTAGHEVFIAEMGARRRGDIKALCKLFPPDASVVTAVGGAHLATFGSRAGVLAAKGEIVTYAKEGAFCVFSADTAGSVRLHELCPREKLLAGSRGDVQAHNVRCDEKGGVFLLTFGGLITVEIKTLLLGVHNASNIALAAAVAWRLGMTPTEIADAARGICPVPHRLQLLPSAMRDLTIIDDSYNACPESAAAAFAVVSLFACQKAVITPGLVEQGAGEGAANVRLGKEIAAVFDLAFPVGRHAGKLVEGLLTGGMPVGRIFSCATVDEAVKRLAEVRGDKRTVVLFENDLPDSYRPDAGRGLGAFTAHTRS